MDDHADVRGTLLEEEPPQEKPKRSVWGLLGMLAIVVIVILVLLLLTRCGPDAGAGGGDDASRRIINVQGRLPQDGMVSVWVSDETDIEAVLSAAGVGSAPVEIEQGKFIVTVPEGKEEMAVRQISAQEGVYDAGLVFKDDAQPTQ